MIERWCAGFETSPAKCRPEIAYSSKRPRAHDVTVAACHFGVHAFHAHILGFESCDLLLRHSTTIVAQVIHIDLPSDNRGDAEW